MTLDFLYMQLFILSSASQFYFSEREKKKEEILLKINFSLFNLFVYMFDTLATPATTGTCELNKIIATVHNGARK